MKNVLSTKLGKALAAVTLLLFVFWMVLRFTPGLRTWPLLEPILLALIITIVLWVAIDVAFKEWQRRRQASFDARLAAREGIEDRRREWNEWTTELRRQGIDRYQLPSYLLVGEPQSGKSILLRNSDLHFPFGQNRLSGVGGTKGCDWWFTDQAVILDLAGRLFTHEGGASDEAEWVAFLELLANYRPQCPANGVILVLPCDALANDAEPVSAKKAAKMQAALSTLTGKLEVRLPVYVVLTKADKVFGFAECVHRLDAEKRHEMFGWSRPLEKLEAPFDLGEAQAGFEGVVERARLLRSQMLATARIPEALSEVDRFYAFPDELAALWPSLRLYLERIFSESRLIDMLFFRGFYLTSGLQSGAPIAKVCAELLGSTGEADRRNLEGLFVKQRAYFIKDLVRERIFTEQGLVRPTRRRVVRARRNALIAYGLAGASALGSISWTVAHLHEQTTDETTGPLLAALGTYGETKREPDDLSGKISALGDVKKTLPDSSLYPYPTTLDDVSRMIEEEFRKFLPELGQEAATAFLGLEKPRSFEEFQAHSRQARALVAAQLEREEWVLVCQLLEDSMPELPSLSTELDDYSLRLSSGERERVLARAQELWDGALDPGSGFMEPGPLGFWLAWNEVVAGGRLKSVPDDCRAAEPHWNALYLLLASKKALEEGSIAPGDASEQLDRLGRDFEDFVKSTGAARRWEKLEAVRKRITDEGRPKVEQPMQPLLASARLEELSQPTFLGLDTSAQLLRDLGKRPPEGESEALQVFRSKCACRGSEYQARFPGVAELRAWVGIGGGEPYDAGLSEHLGALARALETIDQNWHAHVLTLIDAYELALWQDWKGDPAKPGERLKPHLQSLPPELRTERREQWLGDLVGLLAQRLGETVPRAATQFLYYVGQEDVSDKYVSPLVQAVQEFQDGRVGDAAAMSVKLLGAKQTAGKAPETGAGWLTEKLFEGFCERALASEIRPTFLRELDALVGETGEFGDTMDALWGQPGKNADLALFDRESGALDILLLKYRLAIPGAAPDQAMTSPKWSFERFSSEDDARWQVLRFLTELQGFLLSGDEEKKRAASSTIKVSVKADERSPAFLDSRFVYFYVQGGSSVSSGYEHLGPSMKPVSVTWPLGTGKEFKLRWAIGEKEQPEDLFIRRLGVLAPLLLAWEGATSKGGWRITQRTQGPKELEATVTLQFSSLLPARPERSSFASE